jgi:uncharacterized protein YndB with AHSA1/START domain
MRADDDPPTTAEAITATRRIAAPPGRVFTLLADPRTHAGIHGGDRVDGAGEALRIGRVDGAVDTGPITGAGQRFRMAMHHDQHPDGDYETLNEVLTYEPPTAISWRTGYLDDAGVARFGGWLWRYDLAPADEGGTDVVLTYDWSAATREARDVIDFPPFGPDHLHDSLTRLADVAATPAG